MTTKILFVKTAYYLLGLLILGSLGFNIYQYQRNNKLSEIQIHDKSIKNESTMNYNFTPEVKEDKNKTGVAFQNKMPKKN